MRHSNTASLATYVSKKTLPAQTAAPVVYHVTADDGALRETREALAEVRDTLYDLVRREKETDEKLEVVLKIAARLQMNESYRQQRDG